VLIILFSLLWNFMSLLTEWNLRARAATSVTSPLRDEEENMEVDTADAATSQRGIEDLHSTLFFVDDSSTKKVFVVTW
jgi:hypothetical protein